MSSRIIGRRHVLGAIAGGGAMALTGRASRAATLVATPRQSRGPFYPAALPADRDADLVRVTGEATRALGTVAHVMGRVLGVDGAPLAGSLVEIWQCDAGGVYHHPRDGGTIDPGFQGYGQTLTDSGGGYRFRTIKPVPYPGRTPHIHFAVTAPGGRQLVTQLYVAGEPRNERDFLLNRIADAAARASVVVPFAPAPEVETGALKATFDIRMG